MFDWTKKRLCFTVFEPSLAWSFFPKNWNPFVKRWIFCWNKLFLDVRWNEDGPVLIGDHWASDFCVKLIRCLFTYKQTIYTFFTIFSSKMEVFLKLDAAWWTLYEPIWRMDNVTCKMSYVKALIVFWRRTTNILKSRNLNWVWRDASPRPEQRKQWVTVPLPPLLSSSGMAAAGICCSISH